MNRNANRSILLMQADLIMSSHPEFSREENHFTSDNQNSVEFSKRKIKKTLNSDCKQNIHPFI